MARQFLVPIDLAQNELQNAKVQNLAAAPTSPTPVKGQLYFNSTDNTLYWYDGSGWVASKGGSGTPTGAAGGDLSGSYPNPTIGAGKVLSTHFAGSAYGSVVAETSFGQPTDNGSAATVSKSDHTHGSPLHNNAAHSSIPLSSLAQPTGTVNMNNQVLTGLPLPTGSTDAVPMSYVDGLVQGLAAKDSVRCATTANIASMSGTAVTVDGVTPAAAQRVLVKDQTTPSQNGIYVVQAGAWTRALDADAWGELPSAYTFVEEGTVNKDTGWVCTSDIGGTLNTTAVTWVQFSSAGAAIAGAGLTKTGNTIDVVAADASLVVNADNMAVGYAGTGSAVTAARSDHTHAGGGTVSKTAGPCAAATSTVLSHTQGKDCTVAVYRVASPFDEVECDVEHTSTTSVTVRFAVAPAAGAYQIVVTG